VEKIKTHFVLIFFFENRAVYEIMWKNILKPNRPYMTIWRMRVAFWIPKATNTHSEYVIPNAFPLQQWLHERPTILRYTYICSLVITKTECVYRAVRAGYFNLLQSSCFFTYHQA